MKALVTSGPTREPIDPVRYLSNRSSGRQGHAIAEALRDAGAEVTLVSGPVSLPDPKGMTVIHVETAREMLAACRAMLPVEVAVCAAAVSDWRARKVSPRKIKKETLDRPVLELVENPDILRTLSRLKQHRPTLVIGFALETEQLLVHAEAKRERKGCDWIVANHVARGAVFGAESNEVTLLTADGAEPWPRMTKAEVAARLAARIAECLSR